MDQSNVKKLYIVYIFILALPFSWAAFVVGSFYRVATIVLFLLYLVVSKFIIRVCEEDKILIFCWLAYIGYSILTTFWAVNQQAAISNSMGLLLLGMIVVVFFSTTIRKENAKIDYCWIASGVLCAFLYIFGERTSVGEYGSRTSMVIMGTPTDPNEFASAFIVPAALLVYELINSERSSRRVMCCMILLVIAYCVLMSGSRGALISVVLAGILTYLFEGKMNAKTIMIAIAFILAILITADNLILPLIPQDVLNRLSLAELLQDGGSGRSDIWIDAIRKVWNGSIMRLFFGYGQYGLSVGTSGTTQTMHNQLLQQLTNYGIVGLVLYIALIANSYMMIRKRCPRYTGAFWGMMLMSMTITMSSAYKLLWIFLLMPVLFHGSVGEMRNSE